MQSFGNTLPTVSRYVPKLQSLQTTNTLEPNTLECRPFGQSTHATTVVAPVDVKYLPAGQSWHSSSDTEFINVGRTSENLPLGHNRHAVASSPAPSVVEYRPRLQILHSVIFLAANDKP